MKRQLAEAKTALKLNEDSCSRCYICTSLCPYEAVKKDEETGKTYLEIEKCQVCGLCYSSCPSKVIDVLYYDMDSLVRYLEKAKQECGSDTLVAMCKGSAPDFSTIERLFGVKDFIPLSVPCVGRIPGEVLLKAVLMGITKIYVLACDEDYCRFERGSTMAGRKVTVANALLEQLGYGKDIITLKRNSLKVKVDRELCIRCGNCVFYCPYHAAKLDAPGGAIFDLDACRGCGLCVAMCPAFALELENWERGHISGLISRLSAEMRPPRVLVFRCQWAIYPGLNGQRPAPHVRYIDLPCAARVDTSHILEAFQQGIDGVLIAACAEEDCKQEGGSGKTQHSVAVLKGRLKQIGLEEKLHFCTVAPRNPDGFNQELAQFVERLKAIRAKGDA